MSRLDQTTFELGEEHLLLARRMYIDWDHSCYDGAPAVGIKRPYGNGDVVGDVYEILRGEWDYENHDGLGIKEADPDLHAWLLMKHREMELAVQILLIYAGKEVQPGTYHKVDRYDARSWVKV